MNFDIVFVLLALIGMIAALVWDKMRPGMVLLTVVVFFLCVGILTPKEMLEGFSNKGMITVAMLFLVSEGVRQSGALGQLIKKLLPEGKTTVFKAQARMLPPVAFVSAFLNNTPVVVIRPDHQAMGGGGEASGHEILDPSLVCHDIGRYMYLDRYFYESGGARHDSGGGI